MNKLILSLTFLTSFSLIAETQEEQGHDFLVNGNYIGCGIPLGVMKRAIAAKTLIPPTVMNSFFPMAASAVFKPSQLASRNADNTGVEASFNVFDTPRGVKAMNFNCLSCHGDSIDGQYLIGVGNRTRDFTQDLRSFTNLLPLFAWTPAEQKEVAVFQRAMTAIAPYVQTKTVGVNPAVNLTYALFANRQADDFLWSKELTLAPPSTDFPPVDVPPWWRMGQKNSMFYNGEFTKNHHRIMTLASTLCIEDAAAMQALEEPFRNVEAYIKSLKAPVYPKAIDQTLAAAGKPVYEANCQKCHGSYGDDGTISFTDRIIPIEKIGTDPALMEQQTGPENARFRAWGEESFTRLYNESFGVEKHLGYVVPPLNGVWATAPFLHNGSVPTLEAVLNSKIRPKYWEKLEVATHRDYDVENVGVKFKALSSGQSNALPLLKRYIYDTTLKGYGNQGHTYGDQLSEGERKALIEYLKTI